MRDGAFGFVFGLAQINVLDAREDEANGYHGHKSDQPEHDPATGSEFLGDTEHALQDGDRAELGASDKPGAVQHA